MSDQIGRLLEEQYGMARNRLGDFSATSPLNRESSNVEDRRAPMSRFDFILQSIGYAPGIMQEGFRALTTPKVGREEWQQAVSGIGDLLPQQRITPLMPGTAHYTVPKPLKSERRLTRRADGGSVGDILSRAWDSRPWKDYATNPPSMAPQIGIALGLLSPTLSRATRDMSMARGVSTPAMVKPPKEASAAASAPPSVQPGLPAWQLRENYARGPANSNKPLSNVERYEAYLSRMYDQGAEPVTFRAFLRGIE